MTESIDEDVEEASRKGKIARGEEACPICDEPVKRTRLPEHIRDAHSDNTDFPEP